MSSLNDRFGDAVRRLRIERGWSQETLALAAELNRTYLGEIERGDAMPSLASAAKIAAAFGIPLSVLIGRCERPSVPGAAVSERPPAIP